MIWYIYIFYKALRSHISSTRAQNKKLHIRKTKGICTSCAFLSPSSYHHPSSNQPAQPEPHSRRQHAGRHAGFPYAERASGAGCRGWRGGGVAAGAGRGWRGGRGVYDGDGDAVGDAFVVGGVGGGGGEGDVCALWVGVSVRPSLRVCVQVFPMLCSLGAEMCTRKGGGVLRCTRPSRSGRT